MEKPFFATLAAVIVILAITEAVFGFLHWLYPKADKIYRKQLISVVRTLKQRSLFQIGHNILVQLLDRTRSLIATKSGVSAENEAKHPLFTSQIQFFIIFGAIALVVNAISFILASTFAIATHFESISSAIDAIKSTLEGEGGWLRFFGMNTLVGILGACFDILSLIFTWFLISWAVRAKSALSLVGHLSLDLIVAAISCMWAYAILSLTLEKYYDKLLPAVILYSGGDPENFLMDTLWATLNTNPAIWYIVVFLGISAAIPTVIYLLLLIPVISLRLLPGFLQRFLALVLFTLSTDKLPVMKQLQIFVATIGSILGGIITWLEFLPA